MTEKSFEYALRRGLGSAIIELKGNDNREQYRDAVLRCCLRDISYDTQVEGTKGYYLYTAIKTFDDPKMFLDKMAEKFDKRLYWRLSEQLCNTLRCFSDDGYKIADEALEKKYNELKNRLPLMKKYWYFDERELFESLMIWKINGGFKFFKQCINDMSEMIEKRGNDDCLCHDMFFAIAKDKFGEKRVNDFVDEMYQKSDGIKVLIDTEKTYALSREQHQAKIGQEKITVDILINAAKEAAFAENPRWAIMRYRNRFMKNASETEILELANAVLHEENETVKGLLLRLFWQSPVQMKTSPRHFPLEITSLLQYVQSDNEFLIEAAVHILEEVKDERIHNIAMLLLKAKGIESLALALLKKNYEKFDDGIICAAIKKTTKIQQHIQSDINDIYLNHRSANVLPALLKVYQKGECSHCRYNTIKAMKHCGVLPDEILEECLYDSYEDTRKYAKRLLSRRR